MRLSYRKMRSAQQEKLILLFGYMLFSLLFLLIQKYIPLYYNDVSYKHKLSKNLYGLNFTKKFIQKKKKVVVEAELELKEAVYNAIRGVGHEPAEYVKKGLISAIGKLMDYQIILNSTGWYEKSVLTMEDLAEINAKIEEQYAVVENVENEEIVNE